MTADVALALKITDSFKPPPLLVEEGSDLNL